MKNKFKRITASICAFILMLGMVGCKDEIVTVNPKTSTVYAGTHINNVKETDIPFVKDGKTDYILVVPEKRSNLVATAIDDFVLLFERATGITIPVVPDVNLTHTPTAKYISLGNNTLFQSTGLSIDSEELGFDGYQIFTKDKCVYMLGAYDEGTAYSIYSFFEHMFNYECYYADCVVIDTDVKNINLKNLAVKEIPDIPLRSNGSIGELQYPRMGSEDCFYYQNRMKAVAYKMQWQYPVYSDYSLSAKKEYTHTTAELLPRATYGTAHEGWFSNNGDQLCYTARGNADEFEWMAQEAAKKVVFSYVHNENPYAQIFQIGLEDNYNTCSCSECLRLAEYYGSESGALCVWINRVGDIFKAWETRGDKPLTDIFDERVIGEDADWMTATPKISNKNFRITFFAYNNYALAPVSYNEETKKWEATDDKVFLHDNIGVYYAHIESDFSQSIFAEDNEQYKDSYEAWGSMTDTVWNWNYAAYMNKGFLFYDCFNMITNTEYAFRANNNVKMIFQQLSGYGNYSRQTTFKSLAVYLHYKLAWNTSLDTQELIDNYFKAMYGEAAAVMQSLFVDMRAYAGYISKKYDLNKISSIYLLIDEEKYWKKQTLKEWMDRCDHAEQLIAKYENSNPEYYHLLRGRIRMEYMSPAYLYLKYYGDEILSSDKKKILDDLQYDVEAYELGGMLEGEWGKKRWDDILKGMY